MTTPHSTDAPLNVNPDDVAAYIHTKISKEGTMAELAASKRVADAMEIDSAVRSYVDELERLLGPTLHPQNHPSLN